jgi:hypothetical protein
MNKTELAYSLVLDEMKRNGDIESWRFEAIRLKLAEKTHLTVDFYVIRSDGLVEFHEVKACRSDGKFLVEDDARVKLKVAAELYPEFAFLMAGKLPAKSGGGWKYERVGG